MHAALLIRRNFISIVCSDWYLKRFNWKTLRGAASDPDSGTEESRIRLKWPTLAPIILAMVIIDSSRTARCRSPGATSAVSRHPHM